MSEAELGAPSGGQEQNVAEFVPHPAWIGGHAKGVELEVTGAPVNGWVPVTEPSSGQAGFVSDQFVTLGT